MIDFVKWCWPKIGTDDVLFFGDKGHSSRVVYDDPYKVIRVLRPLMTLCDYSLDLTTTPCSKLAKVFRRLISEIRPHFSTRSQTDLLELNQALAAVK